VKSGIYKFYKLTLKYFKTLYFLIGFGYNKLIIKSKAMTKDNTLLFPFFRELSVGVRKQAAFKVITFQLVPPTAFSKGARFRNPLQVTANVSLFWW
jgi:hypothetical protein